MGGWVVWFAPRERRRGSKPHHNKGGEGGTELEGEGEGDGQKRGKGETQVEDKMRTY